MMLFPTHIWGGGVDARQERQYDVAPDGRFLINMELESAAAPITGHMTRSVFDRYDITSEEDLAEASRKLQALAGTIAGTNAKTDAEALKDRLAKSVTGKGLESLPGMGETPRL